jgi:ABC-type lipoprotein release transport system permease subunit
MRLDVAFFLARRGLRESLLSTALMIVAVAVGIGFEVPTTANLKGYRAELLSQSLDDGFGDVRVRPAEGVLLTDADALASRLGRLPGVVEATPVLMTLATLREHGRAASVSIMGVEPAATFHPYRVTVGKPLQDDPHQILLGESVAHRFAFKVGDPIDLRVLLSAYPRLVLDDDGYGDYTFTIRGLVGFGATDSAVVARSFLIRETGNEGAASTILLHLRDHASAPAVAAVVARAAPGSEVRAWMDDSTYLRSSVQAAETLAGASWVMGVLAVGVPVLALLYVSTLNRRRQIGLLTAMGFSRLDLFVTFLLQAFMLGAAGVLVGAATAVALVRYLVAHPIFNWQGFVVRPVLSMGDLVRTGGAILATALVAGSYPAWRAARLDPSRILRGIE